MKLTFNKISDLATGAAYSEIQSDSVIFHRFTRSEEEYYRTKNPIYHRRAHYPAGVKLSFRTNSKTLLLRVKTESESTRGFFSVDLFKDGEPLGYIDNFSDNPIPADYVAKPFPGGSFSGSFVLGEGENELCIHLPITVCTAIEELSLDEGAYAEPIKPKKRLVAYGDSITQGYDALRPSSIYSSKLCKLLGAEEINKAIGGEGFAPSLAELASEKDVDYVTIAYGTNDAHRCTRDVFAENCKSFFTLLSNKYPSAKFFAITPIWRVDNAKDLPFGSFFELDDCIRECAKNLDITVISGMELVPHEAKYFGDGIVHPSDEGFGHYAKNLYEALKSYL